ncbi:hypothetical protein [Pyxidicoccus caerfyrddinensis]|uniref:hypothetical protein n=1 Tax=Pyxidicoccus caerfyrddinensis TaxID=2709663 RepID=UPI0013D91DC4|nr:hypothetical protein [Pyxidicoccus caerfyrddinensis]
MHELIEYGAHATIRDRLSKHLAGCSERQAEVHADFLALPGNWEGRLNYWAKMMTAFSPVGGFLNHVPGITDAEKQRLRSEIEDRVLRMRRFDEEEAAHPHLYDVPADANTRAKRELIQGIAPAHGETLPRPSSTCDVSSVMTRSMLPTTTTWAAISESW